MLQIFTSILQVYGGQFFSPQFFVRDEPGTTKEGFCHKKQGARKKYMITEKPTKTASFFPLFRL